MEVPVEGWIPKDWQGVATFIFAVTVIAATAIQYWRTMRKAEGRTGGKPTFDVKVLGAAFSETSALQAMAEAADTLSQTVKELRAINDREAERDLHRHSEIVDTLDRIAQALERCAGMPNVLTRRRTPRT